MMLSNSVVLPAESRDERTEHRLPTSFVVPAGSGLDFSQKVVPAIYRSPHFERFAPLFQSLEGVVVCGDRAGASPGRITALASAALDAIIGLPRRAGRRLTGGRLSRSADVMVIGGCGRRFEIASMQRLVLALAKSGRSVVFVAHTGSAEMDEVRRTVDEAGCSKRVQFLDPWSLLTRAGMGALHASAQLRARRDVQILASLLPPGISLGPQAMQRVAGAAASRLLWEQVRHFYRIDALIVRNHFIGLSAVASLDCSLRGIPTTTFQHGVIGGPIHFCPLTVHRMVCFGESSKRILSQTDAALAEQCGRQVLCREYIPGGSINDPLRPRSPRRESATVLVFDERTNVSEDYSGIGRELKAVTDIIGTLLSQSQAIRKVIVRPHPSAYSIDHLLVHARNHPDRVEISHPGLDLDYDLSRCSACVALCSGALTSAAACGIPSVFLWRPGWYFSPDLACFGDLFVDPEHVVAWADRVLGSASEFEHARETALSCARDYYHELGRCGFDESLLDRILAPLAPRDK